jgi:carboxyl-terminal processing protease
MLHRLLLSTVCCLALLASSLPPAAAQDVDGLEAVRAAYHDMLDLFYRPVAPSDLLHAGWNTLRTLAPRRGAPAPDPLPDLPDDPDGAFTTFASAYATYVASLPPSFTSSMAAAAIESGMADSVHEQHTHYLPPSIMQRFLATVGGGDESIGAGVELSGNTPGLITAVAPGGPADTVGMQPGDLVVAVDGQDISTSDTASLASTLVGPQGSTVKLTIDRGDSEQKTFVITRGPYYFPPLDSILLPGGVGYVRLTDFVISGTTLPNGTELLSDLDRRLDDLDGLGAQSLILDLRNNGGGSVQTADEILGRFLPDSVRTVREYDERGHQTFEIASGRLHARQLPMAVLINGGSASASEMTAAALRDSHRAILVGQKTAGALASSELLPLPGGGGLQIAVAAANAPDSTTELDGIGVSPDVVAAESRSVSDFRTGHDPLVDVAVAALSRAPAPPPAWPATPALGPLDLDRLVGSALPGTGELPTNDRLTVTTQWQRLDYVHANELIDQNGGAPDPVGLLQAFRGRGYQGTAMASYGAQPGDLPTVSVDIDLYSTTSGAHAAISTNDIPDLQRPIDPPILVGEETAAYRGAWLATGSTLVVWRRGRAVFTVTYSDVPGFDRPDTLAVVVQLVDARAAQLTIPH